MTDYSTLDIQKALKIPRERFRSWEKEGFVTPTTPADGQGTRASYTLDKVYCIALFQSLLNRGFARKVAARLVNSFWEKAFDIFNEYPIKTETKVTFVAFGFLSNDKNEEPFVSTIEEFEESHGSIRFDEETISGPMVSTTGRPREKTYWKHLHIVNVKRLIEEVNSALEDS